MDLFRPKAPAGSITLEVIKNSDSRLRADMKIHYSQPKGFVGRNICYAVVVDGVYYGATVAGSATKHLPGRNAYLGVQGIHQLKNYVNNIFYHVEPKGGSYPTRNFTQKVVKLWRETVLRDWPAKYGDEVLGFETLVAPPRRGECYLRDGWEVVGMTKGFTCKRTGGKGTDSWGGKRVWDKVNLQPKIVLCRRVNA